MYGGALILMNFRRVIEGAIILTAATLVVGLNWYMKYSHGTGIIYDLDKNGVSAAAVIGIVFGAGFLIYALFLRKK